MKNCPNGCGNTTERKHCKGNGCTWYVCVPCELVFDHVHLDRKMKWNGKV